MWHTTDQTPREGADIVAMNEHRAELGFYRRGDLHICGGASRIAVPLVAFTHWAYAPIFVDCFNDGIDYTIMIDGKQHRFEYGDRFGPVRMTKNGSSHKKEWTARQWDCVQAWCDQGRRHQDGVCIYDDPKGEVSV